MVQERFVEHTLQLALEACLDVASHIISEEHLGEPRTNSDMFQLLAKAGWLETKLAGSMKDATGFRNVLVHGYLSVDLAIVRDVVENRHGDLLDFVAVIRARLPAD